MSSSRASRTPPATPRESAVETLGFDPDALWVRDAGLLFDPHFLGALHGELLEELGREEAHATLLQIGFLQGLRESQRVLDDPLAGRGTGETGTARSAPLAIQLRVEPGAAAPGGIALAGCWPERSEASARLASIGVAGQSACAVSAGFTSGWLSGMLDADVLAVETSCAATGAPACRFAVRDVETWRAGGDEAARAGLDALPYAALRELVLERTQPPAPAPPAPERPGLEGESAVVHIWGPVMVVPWAGPDEAQAAIELMGRDAGARDVSVIVLDLSGATLDEGFAAAALVRIIETIETRGAELLVAGASPLAEGVLAGLERRPIGVHKDLDHAVAAAFQIAEAQRRAL
jgi:anti-anti-sigma regulatory factor